VQCDILRRLCPSWVNSLHYRSATSATASSHSADIARPKWRLYRYPDFVADASRNGNQANLCLPRAETNERGLHPAPGRRYPVRASGFLDPIGQLARQEQQFLLRLGAVGHRLIDGQDAQIPRPCGRPAKLPMGPSWDCPVSETVAVPSLSASAKRRSPRRGSQPRLLPGARSCLDGRRRERGRSSTWRASQT
jgi:hypothetical protein